jgi:hypothetical protein
MDICHNDSSKHGGIDRQKNHKLGIQTLAITLQRIAKTESKQHCKRVLKDTHRHAHGHATMRIKGWRIHIQKTGLEASRKPALQSSHRDPRCGMCEPEQESKTAIAQWHVLFLGYSQLQCDNG